MPEQTEYVKLPDSTGFILYDDYIGIHIEEASWPREIPDFFSTDHPNNGDYCIHWTGASLYQAIVLNLKPDKDLTRLVDEDYALDFMVRGSDPGISFDVRFLDSKTDDPEDLPWRIGTRVDASVTNFDSTWQHMHIPLKSLYESGAWYESWYNPRGEYDWSAVDRFEIVPEVTDLGDDHLYFDNIHITNMDTARVNPDTISQNVSIHPGHTSEPYALEVFPNPSSGELNLHCPKSGVLYYTLRDLNGRELQKGSFCEHTRLDLTGYIDGLYILQVNNGKGLHLHRKFILSR